MWLLLCPRVEENPPPDLLLVHSAIILDVSLRQRQNAGFNLALRLIRLDVLSGNYSSLTRLNDNFSLFPFVCPPPPPVKAQPSTLSLNGETLHLDGRTTTTPSSAARFLLRIRHGGGLPEAIYNEAHTPADGEVLCMKLFSLSTQPCRRITPLPPRESPFSVIA